MKKQFTKEELKMIKYRCMKEGMSEKKAEKHVEKLIKYLNTHKPKKPSQNGSIKATRDNTDRVLPDNLKIEYSGDKND